MNINCLNDDCLAIIFSMIPFKELIIDRRVCKHWRECIDYYVSNETHFIYNQSINETKNDQYFYRYQENVESLLDLNQFEKCIQLMPKLSALSLIGVKANDAMLPILANNCLNITRLHFMCGEESLTFVGFKYLVEKYPNLSHLDLPNCQLDDDLVHIIITNLQNLVHFNFGTDRNRAFRLSRFTGHTLKKIGNKIKRLMIGESMYWDELFVSALISGNARNVTTLKIHLIKLKGLRLICENMIQLKEFYCSFNGGDINTHENNVGVIKNIEKLHNLEVLELIDDGRHHCGINGCQSVYTINSLTQMINGLPKLKVLKMLDYDNWHSTTPNIDSFLSNLKQMCPHLVELGISAGLFDLKVESYGLIAMTNVRKLVIQGDTSITETHHTSSHRKQDYLTNQVVINLFKSNPKLSSLKVENCPLVDEEAVLACLQIASHRNRERFEFVFANTRLLSLNQVISKIPENVSLKITKDEDEINIDLDEDTGTSMSSFEASDSDSIQIYYSDNSNDSDIDL